MTKKWNYEEYKFAVNAAWNAFENTLKTNGLTQEEVKRFKRLADCSIDKTSDYVAQVITWEEE